MLEGIRHVVSPLIMLGRGPQASFPSFSSALFTPSLSEAVQTLLLKKDFLKIKEILQKKEPLEIATLKSALLEALSCFSPQDDIPYFHALCLHPQFSEVTLQEPLMTAFMETLFLKAIQ